VGRGRARTERAGRRVGVPSVDDVEIAGGEDDTELASSWNSTLATRKPAWPGRRRGGGAWVAPSPDSRLQC